MLYFGVGGGTLMNKSDKAKLRHNIESYILKTLEDIYWEFPGKIYPNTTFQELERHADADLTDIGLLVYIEEDLGVELPDAVVDDFVAHDVAALIDAVVKYK
jgi:hypothetical protein